MTRAAAFLVTVLAVMASAQDVPLEYRVKAAYLFNFTKFVEWPAAALPDQRALTICVAAPSPFGSALDETVRGEAVAGRRLVTRTVSGVEGCHVLFVPQGVSVEPLLRNTRSRPVLTVGESTEFLRQGGVVKFIREDGKIRFEINQDAAQRAQLRISSRLLRLARPADGGPK